MNPGFWQGRWFYMGVASTLDAYIEETYSFEEYRAADSHHSRLISPAALWKCDQGDAVCFYIMQDRKLWVYESGCDPKVLHQIRRNCALAPVGVDRPDAVNSPKWHRERERSPAATGTPWTSTRVRRVTRGRR
jgi:hypothetical protein